MHVKHLAVTAAAIAALAVPAAAAAGEDTPQNRPQIVISFDCRHNLIEVTVGGVTRVVHDADPTCPAGSRFSIDIDGVVVSG